MRSVYARFTLIIVLTLMSIIGGGCGSSPQPTPTPTKTPTPPPPVPTERPTATATWTRPKPTVRVVTPTPTPLPPTSTPTPTPTEVRPSPTPTPTPPSPPSGQAQPTSPAAQPSLAQGTPVPLPARPDNVNPLTGLPVPDPQVLQRRPIHVRIGNDPQIRPQIGLNQADVIYEELIDSLVDPQHPSAIRAFMTRITGVYLSQDPVKVWPVRSARLVSIALAREYHAALVHSGASDGIRFRLKQARDAGEDFIDLDEFYHPSIFTTHNEYDWRGRKSVDLVKTRQYLRQHGWEKPVPLRGFYFEDSPPPGGQPAASVDIPYPACCRVTWKYNAQTGQYERYVRGKPHTDRADNRIIGVSNVIIHFAKHENTDMIEDSAGSRGIRIYLDGEGEAWIFRDGQWYRARWRHTDRFQMTEYLDLNGRPFPLKPGRTWVQFVPLTYDIPIHPGP
ncbi:MAG: DUF3048 domain-containing protein [Chloroflexi bacterium]|nr:DUF3048 domain-containing protein [Chloroflexota bacterium]